VLLAPASALVYAAVVAAHRPPHTVPLPQWGSANILEISWTMAGLVVLLVAVPNYLEVRGTLATRLVRVPTENRPIATIIVGGYVRREVLRMFKGALMVVLGVVGMWQPNPTPSLASYTGLVLTAGLFVLGLTVAAQSLLDRRDRELIDDLQHVPGRRWWVLRWWRHAAQNGN
jgi:hypothetical protein